MSEHEQEKRIKNFIIWLGLYDDIFVADKENLNEFLIEAMDILYEQPKR